MKRWILCLLCTLTLGLGFAGLASAEPACADSADQQFLAALAAPAPAASDVPEARWMAKPPPPPNCGPDYCTDAQRQACWEQCNPPGLWCDGILQCNATTCTSTCFCGRCY